MADGNRPARSFSAVTLYDNKGMVQAEDGNLWATNFRSIFRFYVSVLLLFSYDLLRCVTASIPFIYFHLLYVMNQNTDNDV